MSQPAAFVVPEGVVFLVTDTGVTIENQGDVVLHTSFGRPLQVTSHAGSVTLHAGLEGGNVTAAGSITVHGGATAGTLTAGADILLQGPAQVQEVTAGGTIHAAADLRGTRAHAGGDILVDGGAYVETIDAVAGIVVRGAVSAGAVRANANVRVEGPAQIGLVRAARVELLGAPVTARGLQASDHVTLGTGKVAVDAIVAAEVHVQPGTTGRVTIVESGNDLGPHTLKGCLRLVDYVETFGGDGIAFLTDRGLSPPGITFPPVDSPALGSAAAVTTPPVPQPATSVSPTPTLSVRPALEAALAASEPADETWHGVRLADVLAKAAEAPPPVVEEPSAPVDDAVPVAVEEAPAPVEVVPDDEAPAEPPEEDTRMHRIEPAPARSPAPASAAAADTWGPPVAPLLPVPPPADDPEDHPLHTQLVDAAARIADAYADGDVPPSVQTLRTLIEERAYDRVRTDITTIWSDLLKFHQRTGMRVQHQVTTTFNTINALVKKM
jgi:hypothetical protein